MPPLRGERKDVSILLANDLNLIVQTISILCLSIHSKISPLEYAEYELLTKSTIMHQEFNSQRTPATSRHINSYALQSQPRLNELSCLRLSSPRTVRPNHSQSIVDVLHVNNLQAMLASEYLRRHILDILAVLMRH